MVDKGRRREEKPAPSIKIGHHVTPIGRVPVRTDPKRVGLATFGLNVEATGAARFYRATSAWTAWSYGQSLRPEN